MKILIDTYKCIGAKPCLAVAPGTFRLTKHRKAEVFNPQGNTDAEILLAARSCPVLAIRLLDDHDQELFPGTEFEVPEQ